MTDGAADTSDHRLAHLPHAEERAISELLVYVGLELRSLCSAAIAVEGSVSDLIAENPTSRPETVRGLQELDRLIQHMDGLADYLAALAEAARGRGSVDPTEARRVLKLARLREELVGDRAPSESAGGGDGSGEVEFL